MAIQSITDPCSGRGSSDTRERYCVDIDIGGTFTDAIFSGRRLRKLIKVDTTPHDLNVCFRRAFEKGQEALGFEHLRAFLSCVRVIRLSTSLSINLLLERKGLCIGLILETGAAEDFLRQKSFPEGVCMPVVPGMMIEVGVDAGVDEIRNAAYRLILEGADILVISLKGGKGGFLRAEERAKGFVHQYYASHFIGSIPVVTGGQLSRVRDYRVRSNRIVFNAYVHRAVAGPFLEIEDFLREQGYPYPLLLVHADGGSSRVSKSTAEKTISSGAAAGIFGSLQISKRYGLRNVLTVDIGGTSTEIGVIRQGEIVRGAPVSGAYPMGGLPIAFTIGIGGGSVVQMDGMGALSLGPSSVGAFPGPVCYGLGGAEPTLTDAFLLLGYFDEGYFLGGDRRLKRGLAERVFEEWIGGPLGVSCEEAAWRVREEAVGRIAEVLQQAMIRFGLDPADTSLFAVGGCGGCLGWALCEAAGLKDCRVFRLGSVFGTYGTSGMDVVHRYEEETDLPMGPSAECGAGVCEKLNDVILTLQRRAFRDMAAEGFQPERVQFKVWLEVESGAFGGRRGCDFPMVFLWPGDWNAIYGQIDRLFSARGASRALRLARVVLTAVGEMPHAEVDALVSFDGMSGVGGERMIYGGGGEWFRARVHRWDGAEVPMSVMGPCILESRDTTVVIPAGIRSALDKRRNVRLSRSGTA